jgi:FlaA1/EpsC-like NDP-sugar epimerase
MVSLSSSSLYPLSVLLIYYLAVNFFLISYRIIIKHAYFSMLQSCKRGAIKAALYNAEAEGLLVQKMISGNPKSEIRIVTFLEDSDKLIGKVIENIPVARANKYNLEKLKENGLGLLILADPFIQKQRLNELVDVCLALNIRVQQVPPSKKWLNNKLEPTELRDINIEQLLERDIINIGNHELGAELKGKKILVTGAAGSIGSEIVRQVLTYKPAIVIACDIAETPLHELSLSLPKDSKVKMFPGSVCDRVRMEQIFDIYAPEIVYHAAAYKHVPLMEEHPSTAVVNNVMGTQILAELSVMNHVDKFVMISTDKAVNPTNVMGASKRISEIYIQSYSNFIARQNHHEKRDRKGRPRYTKFITTRFGNVLGSNGSVIPMFKKQLEAGGPITITHPEITRYFMTIPEACQLVLEAGAMGKGGEIFVFDMGNPVKIVDLAKKMIRLSGKIPYHDIDLAFTGLRPGEKLYEELLNNAENTLPTYHEKILIANVREYDFATASNSINELIALAKQHFVMETVIKMKEIVPEFKSNNSIFEQMDKL